MLTLLRYFNYFFNQIFKHTKYQIKIFLFYIFIINQLQSIDFQLACIYEYVYEIIWKWKVQKYGHHKNRNKNKIALAAVPFSQCVASSEKSNVSYHVLNFDKNMLKRKEIE